MIDSIYTSVSSANIIPCGKRGKPIKSDPIPLLRDKYLGEYRTELEKAKVRKNLGIADEQSLQWGNIQGFVEQQKDLVQYIELKWTYTNDLDDSITNIKTALDYALYFISTYEANDEAVQEVKQLISDLNDLIDNTVLVNILTNADDIQSLQSDISTINSEISLLNIALQNINVDANILAWVKAKLTNSKTINLVTDTTLEVAISIDDKNALKALSNGLYVYDFTDDINTLSSLQSDLTTEVERIASDLQDLQEEAAEKFLQVESLVGVSNVYDTTLEDSVGATSSVGGITQGTTVGQLKGKTFSEIIDSVLFPTIARDPIYPTIRFTAVDQIVEYGSIISYADLIFTQNDGGNLINKSTIIKLNDLEVDRNKLAYDKIGVYTHIGTAQYEQGPNIIDNKGNVTDKFVPAGEVSTLYTITVTHPWYAGTESNLTKQLLVPFNIRTEDILISLTGKPIIKLPGADSEILSFTVNGGIGWTDVDINGWTHTSEYINNIYYQVWTKKDNYAAILEHKIKFILKQ